jgi:acyl-coenzyme A thioesterase PaaI-like protein
MAPSPFPPPTVPESWATRKRRWKINLYPAFRGSGSRVTHFAHDDSDVRVRLPLCWRNRNLLGTIFGGALYAAVDPFYMLMLMSRLGSDYVIWDKAASIHFRRPGRSTLYARFTLDPNETATIRQLLETERSIDRRYEVDLVDEAGEVHASVEKVIYLRKR